MKCDVTWSMRLDLHGAMCLAPPASRHGSESTEPSIASDSTSNIKLTVTMSHKITPLQNKVRRLYLYLVLQVLRGIYAYP